MIRFDGFSKSFGAIRAVYTLTLTVEAGEVVALLGPNGSGKTTSLKAAAGLLKPSGGRVLIGTAQLPASDPQARLSIVFLPQKVSFPDALTGREVVEFYRRLRRTEASRTDDVLRLASLNGAARRLVGTYSGGMVQRLGLAVAALPDAPAMLLDEPTAALDPDGLCAFYGLVERRRNEGKAVLFTSHHLGDAERLADRFAVMVGGRLAAVLSQGELTERLADRGLMRLRLVATPDDILDRVRPFAPGASIAGRELIIPGVVSKRAAVLQAVQNAGAEVAGLTTEDGRLDDLYRELVGAS